MIRELLLGLDLGTTGVRALLVGADGRPRARAYRPMTTRFPAPGRVEQDPEEMWRLGLEVLRETLAGAGATADEVAALGVVTQRSTALAWDARSGKPLAPAIGWQDQRTAARVAEVRALGIPITTLPSATKLEWWMRHEESVRRAAAEGRLRLGTPDAWLGFRLTGGSSHVTDPGQASCTGLYDLAEAGWNPDALGFFSVPHESLPRVVASSAVVGETPASLLGAPIPVAARAGDQQAASFAQGVRAAGDAKLTLGTAAMLDLHTGGTPAAGGRRGFALALWRLDGVDAFCLEGSVVTAGAVIDWLVALGLLPEAAAVDRVARGVDSTEGVAFVPALQGLGTPLLDEDARGLVGGLTRGSGAAHVVRAALEGIAQRCVDVCEAMGLDERPLRVDGGLARSDLLMQQLADFGGRALERAAETEITALGAAQLAGLAVGAIPDAGACRAHAPPRRFEPERSSAWRAEARAGWARVLRRVRERGAGMR